MRLNKNGSLEPRSLAARRAKSTVRTETNGRIGDFPSSHITDDQSWSIAESLGLTFRQLQIVKCVFDGLEEPSVGHRLGVSCHTIHVHLSRLYKKIGVRNRCEFVVRIFLAHLYQPLRLQLPRYGRSSTALRRYRLQNERGRADEADQAANEIAARVRGSRRWEPVVLTERIESLFERGAKDRAKAILDALVESHHDYDVHEQFDAALARMHEEGSK